MHVVEADAVASIRFSAPYESAPSASTSDSRLRFWQGCVCIQGREKVAEPLLLVDVRWVNAMTGISV